MEKLKRVWTCTVCSKRGHWKRGWGYYGSYAHIDTCPGDLPFYCSDDCRKVVEENIKSGKWRIPILKKRGNGVVKGRVGY